MQKGIKFRIYPNREQKNFIHQTLGCCRLIYNRGLAMRKEGYEKGEKIGYGQTSAMLTELKKQEEFAFESWMGRPFLKKVYKSPVKIPQ